MLVLSRKKGERIHIGDNITVVVTKIEGGRVAVGIEAPSDVRIQRKEIIDKPRKTDAAPLPGDVRPTVV